MSVVAVSYGSIKDASGEASAVAKKLNAYAGSIESTVYNKLNNYSGEWSSNLTNARSKASDKISSLRNTALKYTQYASDLNELCSQCQTVDKSVKSLVSSLTATFKENHGIWNIQVVNAISYFFTKIGNSTGFGRWLGDGKDKLNSYENYLEDEIKEWYKYDGGKDIVKGALVGLLEVAIGILSIAAAVLSGGALLVIIAGVVGGIIAVANGIENIMNEHRAYKATHHNNDPATGKRLSDQNTLQDRLREGDIGGSDSTLFWIDLNNVSESGKWATGIDIVNFACTVVAVVSSCGKLLKNGYKWATGSTKADYKQVFSKEAFQSFTSKVKGNFNDFKSAVKAPDWITSSDFRSGLVKDIGRNLKNNFFNFSDAKSSISSIKAMISIPKDLIKGGLNVSNIIDVGIKSIVFPSLTVFSVNSTDGVLVTGKGGQMQFDFTKNITLDKIFDIGDKINSKIIGSSVFKDNSTLDSALVGKLSSVSNINIAIPEINMPNMELSILRAA